MFRTSTYPIWNIESTTSQNRKREKTSYNKKLQNGKRSEGGQKPQYKNTLMTSLKAFAIQPESWETTRQDHSVWRHLNHARKKAQIQHQMRRRQALLKRTNEELRVKTCLVRKACFWVNTVKIFHMWTNFFMSIKVIRWTFIEKKLTFENSQNTGFDCVIQGFTCTN